MPKLVSLKITPSKRKEMTEPSVAAADAPYYPWGMALNLDDDTMTKLGLDGLPKVGSEFTLVAKVCVTSVSANESQHSTHRSISLQIEEASLAADSEKTATKDLLYSKS